MKNWVTISVASIAVMIVACGDNSTAAPNVGNSTTHTGSSSQKASTGDATAKQVAEEARGNVKCPAQIDSAARKDDAPVDDIVGLRPGLTYEEAKNVVLCNNPMLVVKPNASRGFRLNTYDKTVRQGFDAVFAKARVHMTGREYARQMSQSSYYGSYRSREDMKPGQVKYFVATMGMPSQERVIYAAREQWFAKDRNPLIKSVAKALVGKYGKPTYKAASGNSIRWAYDTRGRYISERSPRFNECDGFSDPDGSVRLSPDCGVVVSASIAPMDKNPKLAKYIQVGVVDQAMAYNALNETQAGLKRADDERKAREIENASKNADMPNM